MLAGSHCFKCDSSLATTVPAFYIVKDSVKFVCTCIVNKSFICISLLMNN